MDPTEYSQATLSSNQAALNQLRNHLMDDTSLHMYWRGAAARKVSGFIPPNPIIVTWSAAWSDANGNRETSYLRWVEATQQYSTTDGTVQANPDQRALKHLLAPVAGSYMAAYTAFRGDAKVDHPNGVTNPGNGVAEPDSIAKGNAKLQLAPSGQVLP
jgi:hypothetical protein